MSSVYMVYQSSEEEEKEEDGSAAEEDAGTRGALKRFWHKVTEDIRNIETLDLKTQALPLARIKKVMKIDENVKMISAEAPMFFSKAVELFINDLTLRAWTHTEENRRRTLLKNDIAMAVSKDDQFDFLIDTVPRDVATLLPKKPTLNPKRVRYYFRHAGQREENNATPSSGADQTIEILQPTIDQVVTLANGTQDQVYNDNISNNTSNIITNISSTVISTQPQVLQLQNNTQILNTNLDGDVQLVQAVMTTTGKIQHVPIFLNSDQMTMICVQAQSSPPTQQVQVVQAQPQIIQVAPQANGPATPVYILQPSVNSFTSPE